MVKFGGQDLHTLSAHLHNKPILNNRENLNVVHVKARQAPEAHGYSTTKVCLVHLDDSDQSGGRFHNDHEEVVVACATSASFASPTFLPPPLLTLNKTSLHGSP